MILFLRKKLEQAKPIYNDRTLISGYLGLESRQGLTGRGKRELSGVMGLFYVLVVMMVTQGMHESKLPKSRI